MRFVPFSITIIVAIALCLGTASCRKAAADKGPGLIETVRIDGDECEISYLYDTEERISSITQCDTVETYVYSGDSIVYTRVISGGTDSRVVYTLNEKGSATGYTRTARDGSVTAYNITYDADGNRIALTDLTHPNAFIIYTIEDHNTVYDTSASSVVGSGNYAITRTFYTSTENTLSNENLGKAFLGNSSENFRKTETFNTLSSQYTLTYFYELDYRNGVSRRITKINDSVIDSRSYEYYDGDD